MYEYISLSSARCSLFSCREVSVVRPTNVVQFPASPSTIMAVEIVSLSRYPAAGFFCQPSRLPPWGLRFIGHHGSPPSSSPISRVVDCHVFVHGPPPVTTAITGLSAPGAFARRPNLTSHEDTTFESPIAKRIIANTSVSVSVCRKQETASRKEIISKF